MPLSEHEQRQLEQIEQSLYSDYPKLAQSVRSQDPRVHYKRRVVEAAIGFVIGVGLLLAGVISKIIFVGVGGFLGMGEKNVAVPFSSLKVAEKNGDRYLVMETTKQALQTAPGYTFDESKKVWVPATRQG